MNKNKIKFILYILIFCVTLTAVAFFYLGTFFGDNITYIKVDKNDDKTTEIESDPKLAMVKEELDKVIKYLNDSKTNLSIKEDLNVIAPLIMENIYDGNYKTITINNERYKVMDSKEYEKFREYFNVTLEDVNSKSYFGQGYKVAYKINDNIIDDKVIYEIGYPKLNGNIYEINIQIIKNDNQINKGIIKVSIVNNHIYYLSFEVFK